MNLRSMSYMYEHRKAQARTVIAQSKAVNPIKAQIK